MPTAVLILVSCSLFGVLAMLWLLGRLADAHLRKVESKLSDALGELEEQRVDHEESVGELQAQFACLEKARDEAVENFESAKKTCAALESERTQLFDAYRQEGVRTTEAQRQARAASAARAGLEALHRQLEEVVARQTQELAESVARYDRLTATSIAWGSELYYYREATGLAGRLLQSQWCGTASCRENYRAEAMQALRHVLDMPLPVAGSAVYLGTEDEP